MKSTLEYQPDFARIREAWDAYWAGEMINRPLVVANVPKSGVYKNWVAEASYDLVTGNVDSYLNSVDKMLEATWYMAESVPSFAPDFGPDQVAAFLGGNIEVSPDSKSTSWVDPIVDEDEWGKHFPLRIDPNNEWHQRFLSLCKRMREHAAGRYVVGTLDLHTNADALSALRGTAGLSMDLYDCPEEIQQAMGDMRALYPALLNAATAACGNNTSTGMTSWIQFWCEKTYAVVQCDFLAMIGPEQAREFIIPAIEEEAQFLDHCVFHLDGPDALRHIDDILAIDAIDVVQWVSGAGQKPMWQWTEVLQKIQAAGKGIQVWDITCEQVKQVHKELKPEGVVYCPQGMESRSEVDDLCEWLEQNT